MADFKLKYQIVADAAKAKAEIRDVDELLGRVGGSAGSAFRSIGPAAQVAASSVLAIGAAAVSTGVALFNLTKEASDFGSEIFDASKKTGLAAESLSAMKFAADQSGSSLEAITGGIAKFGKTVGAANEDTKKAAKFMQDFGITPQEALTDLESALDKVVKRIGEAPEGLQRSILAQKAFGKSGAELIPFLESINFNLAENKERAKELGVTIDDAAAASFDEFGDTLDTVSAQLAGLGRTIGQAFMPQFQDMAEATSEWAVRHKDEIKDWSDNFAASVEAAKNKTADFVTELLKWKAVQQWLMLSMTAPRIFDWATGLSAERERVAGLRQQQASEKEGFRMMFGGGRPPAGYTPGGDTGGGSKGARKSTGDDRTPQQVYQAVVAAFKAQGVGIGPLQGYRTQAQQAALFAKYGLGGAARPGTSGHEFYSAVDLPANISQAIMNKVAQQAGVSFGKPLFHGQGKGGYHRHQGFTKGKPQFGGGEEDAERYAQNLLEEEREVARGLKELSEQMIREEETASQRRLDIRRAEAEIAISIIEDQAERGLMSEQQAVEEIGLFRLELLEQEKAELEAMIPTEERLHELAMLEVKISAQQIENEQKVNKIIRERLSLYASLAVEGRSGDEQIADIIAAQASAKGGAYSAASVTRSGSLGGSLADIFGADLVPMIDEATGALIGFQERLGMVASDMQDFVGGALSGMVDGLAQMAVAWIVTGEGSAKAALEMMAATALSIAIQAGIKAVFEAAEAAAAYARYDFYAAAMHTAAAQMYINTAVIAGAAGIGLALGARAMGGGGGGGGRGQQENYDPNFGGRYNETRSDPFSRETGNPFQSGRNTAIDRLTHAVEGLDDKINSMPAGDVLTKGIQQRRGLVTQTVTNEVKTAGKANGLQRALGMR